MRGQGLCFGVRAVRCRLSQCCAQLSVGVDSPPTSLHVRPLPSQAQKILYHPSLSKKVGRHPIRRLPYRCNLRPRRLRSRQGSSLVHGSHDESHTAAHVSSRTNGRTFVLHEPREFDVCRTLVPSTKHVQSCFALTPRRHDRKPRWWHLLAALFASFRYSW